MTGIKTMMRNAVDRSFEQQIGKLFEIWFVDPAGQPQRAMTGAKKLIEVYHEAVAAIDASEDD